jgi:ABC-type multidrug transport system permease subunit
VETTFVRRSLFIPAGFQDSLAAGRRVGVHFYADADADESATLVARMHVQRAVLALLARLARTAAASEARAPAPGPAPAAGASLLDGSPARGPGEPGTLTIDGPFLEELARLSAEPPLLTVQSETAGHGRPVPSGMRQSLPATIILFMLINTTIYGAVFLAVERQEGMLARIATHPLPRVSIIAGKLLGAVLIALAQAALLLGAARLLMHADLGRSFPGLALVLVCFALVAAALALFWGAILRKPEQVTATTLVVSLFLGAIGGCWWPLEVVPAWMRSAGHISPAAWAMDGLHAIISYGAGLPAVLVPCLILLAYAALFVYLGTRLLRVAE